MFDGGNPFAVLSAQGNQLKSKSLAESESESESDNNSESKDENSDSFHEATIAGKCKKRNQRQRKGFRGDWQLHRMEFSQDIISTLQQTHGRWTAPLLHILDDLDTNYIQPFVGTSVTKADYTAINTCMDDNSADNDSGTNGEEEGREKYTKQQLALPPMKSAPLRELFKRLGDLYGVSVRTRGHHSGKCLVYYRTNRTRIPQPFADVLPLSGHSALAEALMQMGIDFVRVLRDEISRASEGRVVSEEGRALDERDRGFQLLKRLGWRPEGTKPSNESDTDITNNIGSGNSSIRVVVHGTRKGLGYPS